MPEGPKIRLAADRAASALIGPPVTDVFVAFEHLKSFQRALERG